MTREQVNRWLVGLMAVACLVGAAILTLSSSGGNIWPGSLSRAGLLLFAIWLAMPTRGRAAAWANISPAWIVATAVILVVVLRRPWVLVPLFAVLFFLAVVAPWLIRRGQR